MDTVESKVALCADVTGAPIVQLQIYRNSLFIKMQSLFWFIPSHIFAQMHKSLRAFNIMGNGLCHPI